MELVGIGIMIQNLIESNESKDGERMFDDQENEKVVRVMKKQM